MSAIAPRISRRCRGSSLSLRKSGIGCEMLFLRADNETLLKRFSETRRRHPLSRAGMGLQEALEQERRLLAPLNNAADLTIDTSRLSVHELRELIRERVVEKRQHGPVAVVPVVRLSSRRAGRCRFRVRCTCACPTRTGSRSLRELTGRDEAVATVPRQPGRGRPFFRGRARFHRALVAVAGALQSQLPDGGGGLHRWPAPFGVPGRATCRRISATACAARRWCATATWRAGGTSDATVAASRSNASRECPRGC